MEPVDGAGTRAAYDTVAEDYADLLRSSLADSPHERAPLWLFAELVNASGGGLVGDLGCGTGRLTAHLVGLGLEVVGLDLSPGMVTVARREHPTTPFAVGSIGALPVAAGTLAGALAWYSLIHTPPDRLEAAFGELRRTLRPGGLLLTGFQVGAEVRQHQHLYGHDLRLDSYRRHPDEVAAAATAVGLTEVTRTVWAPEPPYDCDQAHLLFRR
ncbi:MAG TPA: methyltransferase domain-containing protein [Iamia sp.]